MVRGRKGKGMLLYCVDGVRGREGEEEEEERGREGEVKGEGNHYHHYLFLMEVRHAF